MSSFETSPLAALGFAARALAISHQRSFAEAEDWLRTARAPEQAHRLMKNAVGVGDIDLGGYGGISISAWTAALRTRSAFYRILDDGGFVRAPLNARVAVTTRAATAYVVAEGRPTPVSSLAIQYVELPRVKAQALTVVTNEQLLDLSSSGQASINASLSIALARSADASLIDLVVNTDTPSAPASGTSAADAWKDLRAGLLAISAGGGGKIYALASPQTGVMLSTLTTADGMQTFTAAPNEIANLPLLLSDGVPDSELILLNSSQVAADAGQITPDRSTQADIEMSDAPTGDATAPTGTQLINLWQVNCTALRASAILGAAALREDATYVITNCNYGA